MQRDFLKFVFVVLSAFLSLGVASAQGPKEQTKHAQTAKTGTHHHSSSKPKTNYTYTPGEAVDLGLSVKWSSVNLGATKPEEYGAYFAWGETEPKSMYTWETYKFRTSGDSCDNVKFSKYNTQRSYGPVDNITILQRGEKAGETVDDVARAKWGGNWRMPTQKEFLELLDNCNNEWTTYNGVKGYTFTSKKNGKSIFLPAAGSRGGSDLSGTGAYGHYWCSSLDTVYPSGAWYLRFNSGNVYTSYYFDRHDGRSVRPVSE